jgi:hypothetical protein
VEELQAELRQLQELERRQQMKEQILALRAKVGRSSEAEGRATIAVLAPTASLPTIAVHPAATAPPLEPAMSAFSAGILPTMGVSTRQCREQFHQRLMRPTPLCTHTHCC